MSHSIPEMSAYLEEQIEELNALHEMDVMEMYRHLTELGEDMEALPASEKTPENFVHGCVSNVYISAQKDTDGRMHFRGSSEAMIIRGYVAILVNALNGLSPAELLGESQEPINDFAERTNIRATLTPSRANAFGNIYALMRKKTETLA